MSIGSLCARGICTFVLLALSACTNVFFHPDHRAYFSPGQWDLAHEEVYLKTIDGVRLHAWLLPATQEPKATVLFLHGNAQNISAHVTSVAWLPKQGYNVLLLDYRGYGLSRGTPQFPGVFADIEAAVDYIARRGDLHATPLVIFGQSLGGALAITASAKLKHKTAIAAVISDSAFSSYRGIAREKMNDYWLTWAFQWPLGFAFADEYSPRRFVEELSPIPLLIVHGEDDRTVPSTHARTLYAAAAEPKDLWLLRGVDHIQSVIKPDIRDRMLQWLEAALTKQNRVSP